MVDTNGDPDNDEIYAHWNDIKANAADRMNLAHQLQNQSSDLTDAAKASKLAATKAGTGHNPSSCATCQAYAGLPPVAE
jgi:glucan biosynthesis protein